jgi:hypothetical protein
VSRRAIGNAIAQLGLRLVHLGGRVAGFDVVAVAYGCERGWEEAARFLTEHDHEPPVDYERRPW